MRITLLIPLNIIESKQINLRHLASNGYHRTPNQQVIVTAEIPCVTSQRYHQ